MSETNEVGASLWSAIQPPPAATVKKKPTGFAADYVPLEQLRQRLLAEHGPYSWIITSSHSVQAGPPEQGPHHRYTVVGELHLVIDDQPIIVSGQGSDSYWEWSKKNNDWYFRDNAEASAEAQAFKRAAVNAGYNLSLYCKPYQKGKEAGYWLPIASRFSEYGKEKQEQSAGQSDSLGELEDAHA
ncbi:MAG: hypothetical protein HKO03_01765 [Acidimicrobiia bacterium]|nr:hypothetical protein [Acidimicrobiia bacterium]